MRLECCARTASGDAAAPLTTPINSRRRIPNPETSCGRVTVRSQCPEDVGAVERSIFGACRGTFRVKNGSRGLAAGCLLCPGYCCKSRKLHQFKFSVKP